MFTVAQGLWEAFEAEAKKMLVAGESSAPLSSSEGNAMLYISTDKALLRAVLLEKDIEGTKVYAGMLA